MEIYYYVEQQDIVYQEIKVLPFREMTLFHEANQVEFKINHHEQKAYFGVLTVKTPRQNGLRMLNKGE